jgi:type IV pilus assembly protein PilB
MVDPTNVFAMDDIKFMTGLNVEPVVVAEASVQTAIARYYSSSREIELAAVAPDLSVEGLNGNGFSQADLVSLDSLNFDQETLESEVEVFEDNDEIDLSSLTRMRLTHCAGALPIFTWSHMRKSYAFVSALTASFTTSCIHR